MLITETLCPIPERERERAGESQILPLQSDNPLPRLRGYIDIVRPKGRKSMAGNLQVKLQIVTDLTAALPRKHLINVRKNMEPLFANLDA